MRSRFDAVFCLAGVGGCDAHAHPLGIAWRVERRALDEALEGERRRLAGWHDALAAAIARGHRHVLLLDRGSGPQTMADVDSHAWERPWDLCLLALATPPEMQAPQGFTTAGRLAMAGLAVGVHARAFGRILADQGSREVSYGKPG